MNASLPRVSPVGQAICVILAVLATTGSAAAQGKFIPSPAGRELLELSQASLEEYRSISAKMRYRAAAFDQSIIGTGALLQLRGERLLLRTELRLQVGTGACTRQTVCDGDQLWIVRDLLGERKLQRVDLVRLRALAEAKSSPESPAAPPAQEALAIGGLPLLIAQLLDKMQFEAPTQTNLGRLSVLRLRGTWDDDMLYAYVPDQLERLKKGEPLDLSKLPKQYPDEVNVYLGARDRFPYRIEFHRRGGVQGKAPAVGGDASALLVLELYDVLLNAPLEAAGFQFDPGEAPVEDVTEQYAPNLALGE